MTTPPVRVGRSKARPPIILLLLSLTVCWLCLGSTQAHAVAGSHITGVVKMAGSEALPEGLTATTYLQREEGWDPAGQTEVREAGDYDVEGLSAGTYIVSFDWTEKSEEGPIKRVQYYHGQTTQDAATRIEVGTGVTLDAVNETLGVLAPSVAAWPIASSIRLGQALSSSVLIGGAASVPGMFAFAHPATVPDAPGPYTADVTFTPTDTGNYIPVAGTVNMTVNLNPLDLGQALVAAIPEQTYAGSAITPDPAVTFGLTALLENADFVFVYSNNTNAGLASVAIYGIGNYWGAAYAQFEIVPATPIVSAWPIASAITWGQHLRDATLTGGTASVPGTFSFVDPWIEPPSAQPISATVVFEPDDSLNYIAVDGTVVVTVNLLEISGAHIVLTDQMSYTGSARTPAPYVYCGGIDLTSGVDYTVAYTNNVNPGLATVTLTGRGNCTGQAQSTFDIWGDISQATAAPIPDQTWTGSEIAPDLQLTFHGLPLENGINYQFHDWTANIEPGTARTYVNAIRSGFYRNDLEVTFQIVKATPSVTNWPAASSITYGQALSVSTLTGGAASVDGAFAFTSPGAVPDAAPHYSASVTFTPTDTAHYDTVSGTVNMTVYPISIDVATIAAIPDQPYTGSAITPSVAVSRYGHALVKGSDYIVAYLNNTAVGQAIVTITGIGNYTGPKGVTFQIIKATPTVTTWPTASAIVRGQALSASTLSGGAASKPGAFAFTNPATVPGALGPYTASVTFTPTDLAHYTTVAGSVTVTVEVLRPTVTALSPSCGAKSGGSGITITGTGFSSGSTVKFGSASATNVAVASATRLTCKSPAGAALGKVEVTVTTPGGTSGTSGTANDYYYTTPYQETDAHLFYSGSWMSVNDATASAGKYKRAGTTGALVAIQFTGTRLYWIAAVGPTMGDATVSLDGKPGSLVHLYNATARAKRTVWNTGPLASGPHMVQISWKSPAGKYVNLDALQVAGTLTSLPVVHTYQETAPGLSWSSGWTLLTNPLASGDKYRTTDAAGAQVSFHFTGVRLSLVARISPSAGKLLVSIDGGTPATVDLYRASAGFTTIWNSSFLKPGAHSVVIKRSGVKNGNSTGTAVNLDALVMRGALP